MLLGRFDGIIGEKNQVVFPKEFREKIGSKFIITKGLDKHLIVVNEENWKTLLEGTDGKPFTEKSVRELQRFILGNAASIELDKKGRFIIPEHLREHANLQSEVVFAGIIRFVEVWDAKVWEEHQAMLSQNIESISERLSRKSEDE